jgi:1,2-diacylglycerol 3-beta-glucosyltransferase
MIWSGTIALHFLTWGFWLVVGLATLMGFHAVRMLLAKPLPLPKPLDATDPASVPFVSVMVSAKNEEAVIGRLVENLCSLDYPTSRYEVWVIDDHSTDKTPALLDQFAKQYSQLRVFHRPAGLGGGKSGALNQVFPLTKGDIIAVFDADAQLSPDLFRSVLPLFDRNDLGAVQVRKQVANVSRNAWIQGQIAEMALDSYFQQQRIAIGGIGELRGNGQFVRRTALQECGGWNESTITDDLDLTIRLHLEQWDVDFMIAPAVKEEGVTTGISLWHQRNRWAEGGYQRYLDYWRPILRNRMGSRKTLDLVMFWITQYFLPTAAIPDTLMAVLRHQPMLFAPITGLSVTLSVLGMLLGLRRVRRSQTFLLPSNIVQSSLTLSEAIAKPRSRFVPLTTLFRALYGTFYMLHWLPIVASTTARISIRQNQLKWVKTTHHGSE